MAEKTTLTEKVRNALRISSKAEPITEEVNDCIAAAIKDLAEVGVKRLEETDALIVRAVILYAKSEFGYSEKAPQFRQAYDNLKMALSLMEDYNTEPEEGGGAGGGVGA